MVTAAELLSRARGLAHRRRLRAARGNGDRISPDHGADLTIIVSFFVAFAGIAAFATVDATMRVALSERVRELAIMRALGFGTGTVVFMLAGELAVAVVMALPVGAIVGLGLAM